MHAIFSHGNQVLGWKAIYHDNLRWLRQAVTGVTSLTKQQLVWIRNSGPSYSRMACRRTTEVLKWKTNCLHSQTSTDSPLLLGNSWAKILQPGTLVKEWRARRKQRRFFPWKYSSSDDEVANVLPRTVPSPCLMEHWFSNAPSSFMRHGFLRRKSFSTTVPLIRCWECPVPKYSLSNHQGTLLKHSKHFTRRITPSFASWSLDEVLILAQSAALAVSWWCHEFCNIFAYSCPSLCTQCLYSESCQVEHTLIFKRLCNYFLINKLWTSFSQTLPLSVRLWRTCAGILVLSSPPTFRSYVVYDIPSLR